MLASPWARRRRLDAILDGTREVQGRQLSLRIGLGARFPYELPNIYVTTSELPFLPHVDKHGWVCFVQSEGLSLRSGSPSDLVYEALDLALSTIAKGLTGENAQDVFDELEAYWRDYVDAPLVPAHLDPDDGLREIVVAFDRVAGRPAFPYVADNFDVVSAFDSRTKRHATEKTGVLVRLGDSALHEPLDPRRFAEAGWVREYVRRHISDADHTKLGRIVARRKLWPFVVLNVPRAAGGRSLVGLHYTQVHGDHPLLGAETREPVGYVAFDRRDRIAVQARGGAMTKMSKMKVAVVGCGSVGGHVAVNLAAAGIGALHLVDHDGLSTENIFRHVLGRSALGINKAVALRDELHRRYPFIDVTSDPRTCDAARAAGALDWRKFDLVVVTIGEVTTSRQLNAELAAAETATVFTWLEPLGIGGHAVLAHVGTSPGCYECLFRDAEGAETLTSTADFAAPGQVFTRDLTGCASVFTPYGHLDASRTAELAARVAIAALSCAVPVPTLQSWQGDTSEFTKSFRLSERWSRPDPDPTAFAHAACSVCGGAR